MPFYTRRMIVRCSYKLLLSSTLILFSFFSVIFCQCKIQPGTIRNHELKQGKLTEAEKLSTVDLRNVKCMKYRGGRQLVYGKMQLETQLT
jgi:hypothetical protein